MLLLFRDNLLITMCAVRRRSALGRAGLWAVDPRLCSYNARRQGLGTAGRLSLQWAADLALYSFLHIAVGARAVDRRGRPPEARGLVPELSVSGPDRRSVAGDIPPGLNGLADRPGAHDPAPHDRTPQQTVVHDGGLDSFAQHVDS